MVGMRQLLGGRPGHYLLLLMVTAGLFLPNLGAASLWDIDEGHNAEAAREMLESGNWVVPRFNFQLRVDKPALLYWLQASAYRLCGVNEFAARLPSVLAALGSVLLTYELGRRLFDAATGLLAGLALASAALFAAAAHFANPDALLTFTTVLAFFAFWQGFTTGGRAWQALTGAATGLAVLAKGPAFLALHLAVMVAFLARVRQLRKLKDCGVLLGVLAFDLVAVPWYALVTAETKGDFIRGFLLTHNLGRYVAPMEGHHGPFYYYLLVLLVGLAPWSVLLGPAVWYAVRGELGDDSAPRRGPTTAAYRFLWCWIGVYFLVFSLSRTKLPNYVLPAYPAVALLIGRFLERWRRGDVRPAAWVVPTSLRLLALVGLTTGVGLLVAGGAVEMPVFRGRRLPGLEWAAAVGLIPVLGAAVAWWCLRRGRRTGVVAACAGTAFGFVGGLAAWGGGLIDGYKAPRPLAQSCQVCQPDHEVRVGCYGYYQPSLVFYCRREVTRLPNEQRVVDFLRYPLPVYLFVPAAVWEEMAARVPVPVRLLGRHGDLYRGCEVVVLTNR